MANGKKEEPRTFEVTARITIAPLLNDGPCNIVEDAKEIVGAMLANSLEGGPGTLYWCGKGLSPEMYIVKNPTVKYGVEVK